MKFTLSWLHDHLDTTASLDRITTTLSAIGLEVESVTDLSAKLAAFTVARIVEAKQHPNADRLRVCQVEVAPGAPLLEIVCGAPNAKAGLVTVFAPLGTYIPGSGITLEKKPVRGVVSNGMLCSAAELGLDSKTDGIIEVAGQPADRVGARYADVVGLSDPVIEVKVTPNRPDCTGVRGIARDLAAAGLGILKPEPAVGAVEGAEACPVAIRLEFTPETASACPVFMGRVVSGVTNGPSPEWLSRRLEAVGQKPINALVDVTNYVSIDRGRPLHVFDADKLTGAVTVRLARDGESFAALDSKTYALDGQMCVVADEAGPVGLAGIMGGLETGATAATTTVLIESAYFDPVRTATTGRRTGITSDARYRFERGVDPAFVRGGLDLATRLILDICGGTPSEARVAGTPPAGTRTIPFDIGHVARLSGLALPAAEIVRILVALGCVIPDLDGPKAAGKGKGKPIKAPPLPTAGTAIDVVVPSWRPDIHGSADLVEEVVRIAGLDRLPMTPLPGLDRVAQPVLTERQKRQGRARRTLAARGLVEAVTYSFVTRAQTARFGGGSDALELDNPMSAEMTSLRPTPLVGLLTAIAGNRNRGAADLALFEIGPAYSGDQPEDQAMLAAGVRSGTAGLGGGGRHWAGTAAAVDAFDVKGDAIAVLTACGFDARKAQIVRGAPEWYHPGRSGVLKLGPKVTLAVFGEVHPEIAAAFDISGPLCAFEVMLDALPAAARTGRTRPPLVLSDLLPVTRDFAFVVGSDVAAADIVKAAMAADKSLVTAVDVFDVFEGGTLAAEHRRSVAIAVTLSPTTATLTDAEIETVSAAIVASVSRATGGEIRG